MLKLCKLEVSENSVAFAGLLFITKYPKDILFLKIKTSGVIGQGGVSNEISLKGLEPKKKKKKSLCMSSRDVA